MDRLMARAVSSPVSAFYEKVHSEAGVKIFLKHGVEAFEGATHLEAVRAGGESHPADIALVGIGIVPNVELAKDAGLECDDGIVVGADCSCTNDSSIFAAGDCTRHIGREGV